MTVVQPNSIAGINSISVQSGNALNLHKSDGTLIRTLVAESGISTYSSISVGSATTDNNADKSINIGLGASIAQHADNTLSFGTNGDERLRIDSSGRLGIGIVPDASEGSELAVKGTDGATNIALVPNANTEFSQVSFYNAGYDSQQGYIKYNNNDNSLQVRVNLAERLRITSTGRVGIGTTTPTDLLTISHAANSDDGISIVNTNNSQASAIAQLELSGGDNAHARVQFECNGEYSTIRHDGNGHLWFNTNGSNERLRITSAGLVGINSTTPSKQLEVQGLDVALRLKSTVATGRIGMEFYDTAAQKGFLGYPSSGNDQMSLQQNEAADFYCYVNGADRLRIRADGRVAIASSLAVTGVCTAAAFVADYPNRNLLINGAMEYRQRDTPHTGTGFVVDRWRTAENTDGSVSCSQEIDGPPGLYNCIKVDCTGDDTSLASGQYTFFEQRVEAIKTRVLGWGASGARPVTVSFWVKTDKLGTYSVAICNSANNRGITKDYTVGSSNTWTRYILTFPGDTSGTWLKNESSVGLRLRFGLASGSAYTTGTLGSWVAADVIGSTNMLNFMDSTSNDWFITGVQLEMGEHASPYEYRDHAREQNDCFRYYLRYKPGLRGVTSYVGTSDVNATTNICNGIAYDADDAHFTKTFPVPMCKEPTIDTFTDMRIIQGGSLLDTATTVQNQNSSLDTLDLHIDNGGSVANYGCFLGCKTESSDFVLNAEI